MGELVTIKGSKDGIRLQLDDQAAWSDVVAALREQLLHGGSFFTGARLSMDLGERQLAADALGEVLSLMHEHTIAIEAVAASARESRNAIRQAGITARPLPERSAAPPQPTHDDALLVSRTVRSGQVVRYPGHITLLGDVNPGAEVIAGGHVVVWGRLRGLVHAGALGDRAAVICALELQPTQLRIADVIARTPEGARQTIPEVARVDDGRIVVEPWEQLKRGGTVS